MTLYMIVQKPRRKYAAAMSAAIVFAEAETKAAAIRRAALEQPDYITAEATADMLAPIAEPVTHGRAFFI